MLRAHVRRLRRLRRLKNFTDLPLKGASFINTGRVSCERDSPKPLFSGFAPENTTLNTTAATATLVMISTDDTCTDPMSQTHSNAIHFSLDAEHVIPPPSSCNNVNAELNFDDPESCPKLLEEDCSNHVTIKSPPSLFYVDAEHSG